MELGTIIYWALISIGGIIGLLWILSGLFTTDQQTVRIVQTFGKFSRVGAAGLNFKLPAPFQTVTKAISLRVMQLDLAEQTKTSNDVFVTIHASVQYHINPERVVDAHYKLADPAAQIKAHVSNGIRAKVPAMTLAEVFQGKDEIAKYVKEELVQTMAGYGFIIDDVLVPNVAPDDKVVQEMNNKFASEQAKVTATNEAEAAYTRRVRAAEADGKEMEEHGKGVAKQRLAISEGARDALKKLEEAGLTPEQATRYQLVLQWLDTQRSLAEKGNTKVIFTNQSPGALGELDAQIGAALMQSQEAAGAPKPAKEAGSAANAA